MSNSIPIPGANNSSAVEETASRNDESTASSSWTVNDTNLTILTPGMSPRMNASPLAARASPSGVSPFRLTRPRSNPRNRTPMRYESPLNADAFRRNSISEEEQAFANRNRTPEAQRTIRPLVGSAIGTLGVRRVAEERPVERSRKQGPSQRKTRRWNNDNFVNLAAEISNGKGRSAAEALLKGHADASKYRSVYNPADHKSSALTRFMEDESLQKLREKFYAGDLVEKPALSRDHKIKIDRPLTPEVMLNRIDGRIRRVVVRALENSFPASKVVNTLENFLVSRYEGDSSTTLEPNWWNGILLDAPTVAKENNDSSSITFRFHPSDSTGGFHRLLLHGLCQFHGLEARSSTTPSARALTASGNFSGAAVKLADEVMKRQDAPKRPTPPIAASNNSVDAVTSQLASVKV